MADIRKRNGKNGISYQVRYASTASSNGYSYASFSTMKEARSFVESGEIRQLSGPDARAPVSVTQAIDIWLDICEREGRGERSPVSPSTLENYRWRARTMKVYPWRLSIQQLKESDVIEFRSWLKRECTPDQGQKVLSSFHSVLLEMKRRGVIADDPAESVTIRPDARYTEPVSIPSVEEMQQILRAADRLANSKNAEIAAAWARYRPMIYLAADTGMRPQEYLVLPLTALDERGVHVTQALDRSNRIGPPKTRAGRRFIPVTPDILQMVSHYAASQGGGGLAFPTRRDGQFQRYNVYVRRGFHRLIEEAGMVEHTVLNGMTTIERRYTPYSLRHFFASMLIEQNKSLKYIQTVMGHENIKMTFDVYGHIIKRKETEEYTSSGGILQYI